jgi:hypothetical protein
LTRKEPQEHTLEFLLGFDGVMYVFEAGYWAKFEVRRGDETEERPHGLRYSFTLHDPAGERLLGFDNAHSVPALGSRFAARPTAHDHWHRTGDDAGRPYEFVDAEKLICDFEREVGRILSGLGVSADPTDLKKQGSD